MNIFSKFKLWLSRFFRGRKSRESELGHSKATILVVFVFVVLAYQLALFVYRSAERLLLAHRDSPDTVFVVDSALARRLLQDARAGEGLAGRAAQTVDRAAGGGRREGPRGGTDSASAGCASGTATASGRTTASGRATASGRTRGVVIRKNAEHSARSQQIVASSARRRVENFPFNPNTVSVDDLVRLGFSLKQAQSIDAYRQKGGKFRRKSDFAKSYVVSDSIFARLAPYIDIPLLDLNCADSAAFDALPGIGGYFARQMVLHRKRLGGSYSDVRQLLEIYHFNQEKLDKIADLIQVDSHFVRPYPLWEHPADSLRLHPAVGNYSTARSIVFYREHNPTSQWTLQGLLTAGVITPEQFERLSLCRIK